MAKAKPSKASARRRRPAHKASTARAGRTPKKGVPGKRATNRWSQRVTTGSDALDLEGGVFRQASAKKIAASLKRSAEASRRRKSGAYRSALSMLTFYINRAGRNLRKTQKDRLDRAKVELRHLFGRE
jgi:hypothetical protein